ncbi:MAG: hypothetical protein JST51_16225 [Armatimonadetes bacterium]|nr:hypothetical protein [Armatimonadota bacterium]
MIIAGAAIQASRAQDILARSKDILGKATTVVGSFTQQIDQGTGKGDFQLKKDRKMALTFGSTQELCDGRVRTTVDLDDGTYTVRDVRVFNLLYLPGFEAFTVNEGQTLLDKFTKDAIAKKLPAEPANIGMTTFDGKEAATYTVSGNQVFLDAKTALPLGVDFVGDNSLKVRMRFQDVKLDTLVDDSTFSYKPAENDAKKLITEPGMARAGDTVPEGAGVESMDLLRKFMEPNKLSIIIFFDDKNGADSDLLNKFDKIAGKTPRGVGIIGVSRIRDWQKMFRGKPKFPLVIDAQLPSDSIVSRFGVTRYPTLYVLDDKRVVRYVQIGAGTGDLDPFLKSIGIANP